jgi:hypothetical protein
MAPMADTTKSPERHGPASPSRRRPLLASLAGLALLLCAFGGTSAASTTSAQLKAELAYARCMRVHGVTNFPDPNSQGKFPPFRSNVSKQTSEAAQGTCQHLLPGGGGAGSGGRPPAQKVEFALKVAQCLRAHGFPNFPDPGSSGQFNVAGTGINESSPRFQSAETACEKQARQQLGIPGAK